MVNVDKMYSTLIENEVDFFTGVPDSLLKDICAYITDNTSIEKNIIAANEGNAIGIASGYYMASGKIPLVYMQNSGIGNAINPLLSLADKKVYSFPILLMIGWRGEPGITDEPQHVKQGEVTLKLLDSMDIPYVILDLDESIALHQVQQIILSTKELLSPHAIIVRQNTFSKYRLHNIIVNDYSISREDALKIVVNILQKNDIVISTTGKLSRELFEYRDSLSQGHECDFLTVGSMGHSSSIALGISIEKRDSRVYCFDGDGSFIMHMGSITNIGNSAPRKFRHIIFNNGAHESVGGQPTTGLKLDIASIATGCGYKKVLTATTKEEIISCMLELQDIEGPTMLQIKVNINSRDNLGRPSSTPIQNKNNFIEYVRRN